MQNIHEHQVTFMKDFEEQGGISFLIIYYSMRDVLYYMPYREVKEFWERAQTGGRKSIRFEELTDAHFMKKRKGFLVPYLDAIQKDLDEREEEV